MESTHLWGPGLSSAHGHFRRSAGPRMRVRAPSPRPDPVSWRCSASPSPWRTGSGHTTRPTGATSPAKSKGPTLLVPRAAGHACVVPTQWEELPGSQQQALAWSVFSLVPRVRLLLLLSPPSPTAALSVKPQGGEMPAGSPFALPQPRREARPAEITDAQRGTGFSPAHSCR